MDEADVTLTRALKIWWSFAWRGMLLMFAIVIPLEAVAFAFVFPHLRELKAGQPPDSEFFRHFAAIFPLLWVAVVSAMVFAQTLAMRWMLRRARWSDFQIGITPKA